MEWPHRDTQTNKRGTHIRALVGKLSIEVVRCWIGFSVLTFYRYNNRLCNIVPPPQWHTRSQPNSEQCARNLCSSNWIVQQFAKWAMGVLAAFTHILTPLLECIVQTIYYFILCWCAFRAACVCLHEFDGMSSAPVHHDMARQCLAQHGAAYVYLKWKATKRK